MIKNIFFSRVYPTTFREDYQEPIEKNHRFFLFSQIPTYKFTEKKIDCDYSRVFKKHKLEPPKWLVNPPVYKITCKFSDGDAGFAFMRKRLYYIKQKFLSIPENAEFISKSYRNIPDGICQIKEQPMIIDNFTTVQIDQSLQNGKKLHFQAENIPKDSSEMSAVSLIYNGQYIGELFPNEHLDQELSVSEYVHKGCHAYWLIIRDSDDELHFYSNYSVKELEKMIKDTELPEDKEEDIFSENKIEFQQIDNKKYFQELFSKK